MADQGIVKTEDVRAEQQTYKQSIIHVDYILPIAIKDAFDTTPGATIKAGMQGVHSLIVFKHSLICLRASAGYHMDADAFLKEIRPADWDEGKRWDTYLKLMDWNKRMVQEYPNLGITEPSDITDVWGDKREIIQYVWDLMGTCSRTEILYLVNRAFQEGHFIEKHQPIGSKKYDESVMQEFIEYAEREKQEKEKVE